MAVRGLGLGWVLVKPNPPISLGFCFLLADNGVGLVGDDWMVHVTLLQWRLRVAGRVIL